jgi:hypothetical protein
MKIQEKIIKYLSEAYGGAYWLSPKNELIPVGDNHISMVISNPEKFGIKKDYVKNKYDSYNEPMGQEGKAREDIIKELVSKNWVRIRRYRQGWSLNVADTQNRKTENLMAEWAFGMLNGDYGEKERDKYADVMITGLKGSPIRTDLESLAKGMNESKRVGIKLVKEITMIDPTDDM